MVLRLSLLLTLTFILGEPAFAAPGPLPKIRVSREGHGFETAAGKPFAPFGVNYYRPGTGWAPQVWKQFDAEATRQDFVRLKQLGGNCVRVFLTYGSFCPQPDVLDATGLAKFDQFLDLAETAGIYVHPTGPDHWEGLPEWVRGDRIADEKLLRGLEEFWKLFAARYRGRGVIFAYDLRNEPSVAWDTAPMREKWNRWLERKYGSPEKLVAAWGITNRPVQLGSVPVPPPQEAPGRRELLDYQLFREDTADEWTRRQATAIRAADPQALVTVGLIQWSVPALLPGVQHYSGFRPERQARFLDFMEIHFYPLAQGFYEYRDADTETRNLAYLESVVREVARPGKPVVVAEFGWYGGGQLTIDNGKHPAATAEQQAGWCRRLVETTAGVAVGWLNWGFYDQPEARDVSQLTGLLTANGTTKTWGREFQNLSGQIREHRLEPRKLGPRPEMDWNRFLTNPKAAAEFREQYLRAFQASQGRKL